MILLAALLALAAPGTVARPAPAAAGRTATAAKPGAAGEAPRTHVEADAIEYLYKEHRTVMTGKPLVKLTREDATLLCRRLVADHDPAGDIHHAVCEGDVRMTRGDKMVTCARATYDAESGKVVCRGDPVLRDGSSVMSCEEVVYDLESDKVFMKQGKGTIVQRPGQSLVKKGKAR